jgi:hypothetical protein
MEQRDAGQLYCCIQQLIDSVHREKHTKYYFQSLASSLHDASRFDFDLFGFF